MSLPEILQIIALIVFIVAAIGWSWRKTDLIAVGLALWVLSLLIDGRLGHLSLAVILLLLAFIAFLLAAIGWGYKKIGLIAVGLALWAASVVIPQFISQELAYSAAYTVEVNAPPSKVFDYVADVSRHGEWGSADDHMKATAEKPGPPATGSRYKADGLLNGKPNQSTVTITALEPPKRLAFDAEDSNSVFHHEFTFSPSDGGTRVERHVTMTKGPFYFPLVLSIFKGTVQKNYNGAMSNLKTKMEGVG